MAKICKKEDCKHLVFSNLFCINHQYLNPKFKPYKYIRKKTFELELFTKIWNERPKKSFLSGKKLYAFSPSLFAHVLPKAKNKFPKWKLNPENIVLLTPEEHTLYDHGTTEQRAKYAKENNCDWNKIYNLYDELKLSYETQYNNRQSTS